MADKNLDFTHLSEDEKINGINITNVPKYIREKAYLTDFSETLAQLAEMIIQLGVNLSLDPDEALEWARKLQQSISQSEFDSWVATLLDGGPSIFMNTLSELQTTYPNGAPGVALVRETDPAKIYVWNGSAWEDFGDYQGIEIKDGAVATSKIANGAVATSKIANGAVTHEKVSFMTLSENHFNKDNAITGGYWQSYNLLWSTHIDVSQTNWISVTEGDTVRYNPQKSNATYQYVYKNKVGELVSGGVITQPSGNITITVPAGVEEISLAFYNDEIDTLMVVINQALPVEYKPYTYSKIQANVKIGDDNVTGKFARDKADYIVLDDYSYHGDRINQFDKSTITKGGFYHATDFTWREYRGVSQSAFIDVQPGDVIRLRIQPVLGNYHMVFRNDSLQMFEGYQSAGVLSTTPESYIWEVTVPENAHSFSTAVYDSEINEFIITVNHEMISNPDEKELFIRDNLVKAIMDKQGEVINEGNYDGKKISILGDSISTYPGYIPIENVTFYSGSNHGVTNVNQTWWKRLIDQTGMILEVNNAWSGSRVTGTSDSAGSGIRTGLLGDSPDVIIVYLGINDFNNSVALGSYNGSQSFPTTTSTFREAYAVMLDKIMTNYPQAEVYVCTLPDCERTPPTDFPEINGNGDLLVDWNRAIKELSALFGTGLIDLHSSKLNYYNKSIYLSDNLHPNANGMRELANKAIKDVSPNSNYSTL